MLHEISWSTYAVSVFLLAVCYYAFLGLHFYRTELKAAIYKLSGKAPALKAAGTGDLHIPDHSIMGLAQPEVVDFVGAEELDFGPPDINEAVSATDSRLIGDFSEMVAEVKTLIRVINESSETKENFEMLFRLIIQKYDSLRASGYRQQLNDYLLTTGVPQFPFELTAAELDNYWIEEK